MSAASGLTMLMPHSCSNGAAIVEVRAAPGQAGRALLDVAWAWVVIRGAAADTPLRRGSAGVEVQAAPGQAGRALLDGARQRRAPAQPVRTCLQRFAASSAEELQHDLGLLRPEHAVSLKERAEVSAPTRRQSVSLHPPMSDGLCIAVPGPAPCAAACSALQLCQQASGSATWACCVLSLLSL